MAGMGWNKYSALVSTCMGEMGWGKYGWVCVWCVLMWLVSTLCVSRMG